MARRKILEPSYLGDGVYVHDQGHGINIAVNHHMNKVVFLESNVLKSLVEYARRAKMID